jgi:hypothetical protein
MADKNPKKAQAQADSLMRESERKKAFANTQAKIANAQIKRGTGNQVRVVDLRGKTTPTASERLNIANSARQSAKRDSIASVNLRPKAIKAAKPSPMPKPRRSTKK